MKPFTLDEAIAHASMLQEAFDREAWHYGQVGELSRAESCSHTAAVLKQFIRDCQQQVAARNAA